MSRAVDGRVCRRRVTLRVAPMNERRWVGFTLKRNHDVSDPAMPTIPRAEIVHSTISGILHTVALLVAGNVIRNVHLLCRMNEYYNYTLHKLRTYD